LLIPLFGRGPSQGQQHASKSHRNVGALFFSPCVFSSPKTMSEFTTINMSDSSELYTCNACSSQIPTHLARISCHSCTSYNMCANCFVIKQFSRPHVESHSTMVLKQSGFVVPSPGFPPRPAPSLPPRPVQTVRRQSIKVSELPTANWGALWNVMKAPLEKRKKGPAVDTGKGKVAVELDEVKASPLSSSTPTPIQEKQNEKDFNSPPSQNPNSLNQFPPSPPKSVRQGIERIDSMAPSYPRPAKWEPLFEEDSSTPTPIFVALMSTVFAHLDPRHTGYLSPEVYSGFVDLQGVETSNNICKFPIPLPIWGEILIE